jgi:Tfp pilus assembly protein PilN
MTQIPTVEPALSPERVRRLLPIRADLLPQEVIDSRRARKVRRSMVAALVTLVLVLAAWYGAAVYQTSIARSGLAGAESEVQLLQQKQHRYDELVNVQAESGAIKAELGMLMANDLQWSHLVTAVLAATPDGVQVGDVTGDLTAGVTTTGAPAVQLPNTTGKTIVGHITVIGHATSKAAAARYVDALAQVPGLGNPFVTSAMPPGGAVDFTVRVDITNVILGGRFTTPTDKKSGAK